MKRSLCILLTFFILFSSCKKDGTGSDDITYELSSTNGGFSQITYLGESGAQKITSSASNNWEVSFKNKAGRPRLLALTAVAANQTTGSRITLKIKVGGSVVESATEDNAFFISYQLN